MTELQEAYRFWKSLHRCVMCHSQDAFTLNGRSYCADCCERMRVYNKRSRSKTGDRREARNAERTKRRESGLCTRCGAQLPPGYKYKMCDKHRAYSRNYKRAEMERKTGAAFGFSKIRWEFGLCTRCGSPVKEGITAEGKPFRLCERCYENTMRALTKANATRCGGGKENHSWMKDNVIAFGNTAKFLRLNG